jgi:N-acetylmuramic acid 6-phosphate etherase
MLRNSNFAITLWIMKISELTTEQRNPLSHKIDTKSTREILTIINQEDKTVPDAVEAAIPIISELVDKIVIAIKAGGRLFYIGAGTSGRLGVLDASECPPTFGVSPLMVQGIIAGGQRALTTSVEWVEDDEQAGVQALKDVEFTQIDVLVGITASGQAPFVRAAMEYAKELGAVVGAIACNEKSRIFSAADYKIFLSVGPEILTGSTRMKAGTAQKITLNMITTTTMIKLGKVYNNFMVDLTPVNSKLHKRAIGLIEEIGGCSSEEAEKTFQLSGNNVKSAIIMLMLHISKEDAEQLILDSEGNLHKAIEAFKN